MASKTVYFDNAQVNRLTFSSCIKGQKTTAAGDFTVSQRMSPSSPQWIGFCVNLDSITNPQNYMLVAVDGAKIYLYKCVAGVLTNVVTMAQAWAAGDELKLIKSGTSYTIYQNNAQRGSTQVVDEATIKNNTLHTQFSTNGANTFNSPFVCQA